MRNHTIPLPGTDAIGNLVTELLSKVCAVEDADEPLSLEPGTPLVLASYVDDDGRVAGIAMADLAFACRAGSALVMMPPAAADAALDAGELDGDMLDCFREVVNVLTGLINAEDGPSVRLHALYQSGQLLPGAVRTMATGARSPRRDYQVSIEEYGEGRLSVIVAASASAALPA